MTEADLPAFDEFGLRIYADVVYQMMLSHNPPKPPPQIYLGFVKTDEFNAIAYVEGVAHYTAIFRGMVEVAF